MRKGSKPEIELEKFLSTIGFLRNQQISDEMFTTKTQRRVLDFYNPDTKTIIEFDGAQHFHPYFKSETQNNIKETDSLLDDWSILNDHKLIRISYEYYSYRKQCFKQEFYETLNNALTQDEIGPIYLGEIYNKK